jgi:acyl-homoserine-lactone acylase
MNILMRGGAVLVLTILAGCGTSKSPAAFGSSSSSGPAGSSGSPQYDVTVTRTQYGIPHIKAADFPSLGYGYGYAFAEDNLCTMMEDYVAIRGQRSQYLGGTGSYTIPAVPVTASNIDSDFFWKLIADDTAVQNFKSGIDPRAAQALAGYVDGFNRYMNELQAGQHPGSQAACANAPWLQNITADDVYRRIIRLAVIASSSALETEIAEAQPPALSLSAKAQARQRQRALKALALAKPEDPAFARMREKRFGSNMYALGPQATSNGTPIVYGNPHFPWTGTERLYMSQLTIPGVMDIEGVSLYGIPVINIGFNDNLAWSHTVSTAFRFTLYQLTLNPLDPTQYLYNGAFVPMAAVPLSIQVLQPNGSLATQTRTLYKSQYGPMLVISDAGIPVLGWTNAIGFTLRDANLENTRLINQFFEWNLASSFTQFKQLHASILGVPWVNTVASGPTGDAYYGDVSVVPNVSNAEASACAAPVFSTLVAQLEPGLPLLDGSRADCQWGTDSDAPVPGIFGPSHLPVLERQDWVSNMNDSYWLTNPAQPLTGYASIIGSEATARSLRTRLGILQVQRRLAGTDGLPGNTFDLSSLQQVVLNSHMYSGELAQAAVLSNMCPSAGSYNTAAACAAIQQWDQGSNETSIGLPVWQEFWRNVSGLSESPWNVPFNVNDPVNTPNTLNTSDPSIQQALFNAQTTVQNAGIGLSTPLAQVQYSGVNNAAGGTKIPIFGAEGDPMGSFTAAYSNGLTSTGYPIVFGNSYIQTVTWDSGGVHAEGFLTYSESTDPANPHYADYTQAYSQKRWYRFPFHDSEIQAAAQSTVELKSP